MPQLGISDTKIVTLPSTAQVKLKTTIYPADIMDMSDEGNEAEQAAQLLARLVTEWNFTKAGTDEPADVTADNILHIPFGDFKFLSEQIKEIMQVNLSGVDLGLKETSTPTSQP